MKITSLILLFAAALIFSGCDKPADTTTPPPAPDTNAPAAGDTNAAPK
jgi:hypothetical protein